MNADALRSVLAYDPASGAFTWLKSRGGRAKAGAVAGCINLEGYRVIYAQGRLHYAHRLAWLMTHGAAPAGDIDHIDGNRANNAIANLRDVSRRVNLQNRRNAGPHNSTQVLGAGKGKKPGKFRSRIVANGSDIHLGTFDSPEAAHAAYVDAKRQLHEGNML